MIESLIGILILTAGVVLFSKNWGANLNAQSGASFRAVAATQAAEIGNVMLAHIANEGRAASHGQIVSKVQQFANDMNRHLNSFAEARGHQCNNQSEAVRLTGHAARTQSELQQSTLARIWSYGPVKCIRITPLPNIHNHTNGIWVRVEAKWIAPQAANNQFETVSVYTLVSPL